jgi:3-oxoacyl-[acyl-carrier protein] reductase
VVLVTGASRGIGKECAVLFAQRGCIVAINYRICDTAAQTALSAAKKASPTEDLAEKHMLIRGDVSDPTFCEAMVQQVVAQLGRLDVLVNNAGICIDHDPKVIDYKGWCNAWQRTMDANLSSSANLSFLACQQFMLQKSQVRAASPLSALSGESMVGRVVNITSRAAYRGEPTAPGYAASKAGMSILGQSLARLFGPEGFVFISVAPGWVRTEMAAGVLEGPEGQSVLAQHPLGRVAEAEEVAKAVVFAALDAPQAMTGTVIDVNGASYVR